jgi:hypothetical protein
MYSIEIDASNNSSVVACVFVAVVTFSLSRCLATVGRYTYRHRLIRGIYKVRGWDVLKCHDIHTKSNKDWVRHSKVNREHTQTYRQHGDSISLLLFFRIYN